MQVKYLLRNKGHWFIETRPSLSCVWIRNEQRLVEIGRVQVVLLFHVISNADLPLRLEHDRNT